MNPQNEHDANRLDELLHTKGERHDARLKPFLETTDALSKLADTPEPTLSSTTKATQRASLISMATPTPAPVAPKVPAPVSAAPAPVNPPPSKPRQPWFMWAGGALATAALMVLIAFVVKLPNGTHLPVSAPTVATVARLVIPEAHAGDAFSLIPEKQDAAGVDPSSAFVVTSTIAISADELSQHLRLVPPAEAGKELAAVPVRVTETGDRAFRVEPAAALQDGKVYRVELATAVQKDDGSLQARDFSWAVQTKNVFRVVSSVPGPNASGVPINTGIEVTMSMPDAEVPTSSFSIVPAVDGHFETHGRSIAFVPTKPLQPGRVYTATWKKGWGVKGSDRELAQDVVISFETSAQIPDAYQPPKPYLMIGRFMVEGTPNSDILVPVWASQEEMKDVTVTGYALNTAEATAFLLEEAKTPWFAYETRKRGEVFTKYAKTKVLDLKPELREADYGSFLVLPKGVPAGRYLMKVQLKDGDPSWFFLESTNVATYSMSDASQTLVWAMNIETKRPLANLPVVLEGKTYQTNGDGVATMPTPATVTATTVQDAVVMTVGTGELSSLVRLQQNRGWDYAYDFPRWRTANEQVVSYLYTDRPIYRTTDTVQTFGVIQNRGNQSAPSNVTLELTKSGYFDFFYSDKEKVYRSAVLTPDASGFYKSSLDWAALAPGYYQLSVKVDGTTVTSRSIEVRDFVKPIYTLEIIPERQAVYAGEEIGAEVRATFFDGTPVGKLALVMRAGKEERHLTTDESGRAMVRFSTETFPACDTAQARGVVCDGSTRSFSMELRPEDSEEAEIMALGNVTIWRSHASLDVQTETKDETATLMFTARRVDLTKAETGGGTDVLGDPIRNAAITGHLFEKRWVRTEDGTYYDSIEKVTRPKYRYDLESKEVGSVSLTTDAAGKASMKVPMAKDVYYVVQASVKDEKGVEDYASDSFARGWWTQWQYGQTGLSFEDSHPKENGGGRSIGERVGVEFHRDGEKLADAANPSFLYVEAHQGIRKTTVSAKSSYEFTFGEEHVPNTNVYGVAFLNDGFVVMQFGVYFDTSDRNLTVTLTSDKSSYAPGGLATIQINAKKKDGTPASNAHVGVGVVDEAVFAAAQSDGLEYPLSSLYTWVSDGILVQEISHDTASDLAMGGAEMGGGGGGGDQIRRNFKDTAAFDAVTLDGNGFGTMTVKLPDNLTTWRATAVAITPDRYAGTTKTGLVVTKPIFVDVVAPSMMLVADKPVLKLRAFGTALPKDEVLTYTVDAPSLGLNNEQVTGTSGASVAVGIDTLVAGTHAVVVRVQSSKGTDALEKKITVLPSRFLRDEYVETELAPGVALADAGASREADILFVPKNRASLLPDVERLAWGYSQRLESKIAQVIAQKMLVESFGREALTETPTTLSTYQQPSGGLGILPYASPDPALSSKVASVAPDLFDRNLLARYLWELAQNKDISREEAVEAVSGLAALGEPVLNQLHAYADLSDLNWREELAIIRGLNAAGAREEARSRFAHLLTLAQENDGKMFLRVSEDKRDQVEATAQAAVLANAFADPSASKFFAWMHAEWSDDLLTDLDRIAYLSQVVPSLLNKDLTVKYTIGGAVQELTLKDDWSGWNQTVTLTAEEMKNFRTISVDGPVVAIYTRQVAAPPAQSQDLTLTRTYAKSGGASVDHLVESDTVIITLTPTFSSSAPSGCYTVRDHLPSGLAPMVNFYGYWDAPLSQWYPADTDGNAVSFIFCKGSTGGPITYRARVVSRGSYLAEPAVMQSMDRPSVAAVSGSQTVTIE